MICHRTRFRVQAGRLGAACLVVAAVLLARPAAAAPEMHGACYASWLTPSIFLTAESDEQIRRLHGLGLNCVALRVTWLQDAYDATDVHPGYAAPTDDSLRHVVRLCRGLGMKVGITLIVDFHNYMKGGSYKWRGMIDPEAPPPAPANPSTAAGAEAAVPDKPAPPAQDAGVGWAKWFQSYEAFALRYASLAQETGADFFCFGAEMTSATVKFEQPWRDLIAKIREVYKGPVTYQANWSPLEYAFAGSGGAALLKANKWNAEYRTVKFWDALDYAALSCYFSLTNRPDPTPEELASNLALWRDELRDWQKGIGKPVLLSEVGYQSADSAAIEPWRTPLHTYPNPRLQARCYEGFLRVFGAEPWVRGIFWWMVNPPQETGAYNRGMGYPFLGKPAEEVVRRWSLNTNR